MGNNENHEEYDLFICHASEDKEEIVRPLAKALTDTGFRVWYDEFTLTIGDSLRRSIDKGLAQSRYGLVILSKSFFQKKWTQKELDGLTAKERDGTKVILPVWHKIDREHVAGFSLTLADLVAITTDKGIDNIVEEVKRVVRPSGRLEGFGSTNKRSLRRPRQAIKTTLVEFEDRAFGAAIFALLVLIYLSFRLTGFWILDGGIGMAGWANVGLIFPPFLIVIAILILQYVFKGSLTRTVINSLRKISAPCLMGLTVLTSLVIILNLMIFLYPDSTRFFFQNVWQDFLIVCALSLGIESVAFILSYFLIEQYFARMKDPQYRPHHVKETKRLLQDLKQTAKTLRNRSSASIILFTLLVTVGTVPVDLAAGLFVPYYHQEESFSHSYNSADTLYLFIYNERVSPSLVRSQCRFYRLAQTAYTVYPAKIPLINAIRVQDPNNITAVSTDTPNIQSSYSDYSTPNLGYVYNSTTPGVACRFVPEAFNFSHIEFEFPTVSNPFVANVSYWKFLENVNITVTDIEPSYLNMGNGSWLETYTLIIVNGESVPLRIMAIEFDRFMMSVVNATTTKVYSQGQEVPWAYFVYANRRLGELTSIGSGYTLNLTISFQSSDIS